MSRCDVLILPYFEKDGAWTLPDQGMRNIWELMIRHRLEGRSFFDGSVRSEDEFLGFMKDPANFVHIALWREHLGAIGWLNGIAADHAYAHYCMFPTGPPRRYVDIAVRSLDYWFGNGLGTLIGRTGADNHLARRLNRLIGFEEIGTIPGLYGVGLTISYLTKEAHNGRRWR